MIIDKINNNTNCVKVAAVVVTYNRLEMLKECLNAIKMQSYDNYDIIIVNNGSTDGTTEFLASQIDCIVINQDNCGGAGGFYAGMKYMYEHDYDALWMMDDDGIPERSQLERLVDFSSNNAIHFLNPVVINRDNHNQLCDQRNVKSLESFKGEFIPHMANVFNGTFLTRTIINKIGLIKREMFIWGDEREYKYRAKNAGFAIGTVKSAIHYHPVFKGTECNIIPLFPLGHVTLKPKPKDKIYYRNLGYLDSRYKTKYYIRYFIYYICRFDFVGLNYFFKYYRMGYRNDYSVDLFNQV